MTRIPIRDLQLGLWVLLEDAGLVQVTGLTWFPESVDIDFDGTNSPIAPRIDRAIYGTWSGLFEDYPFLDVYHHEENPHDQETAQPQT